MNKTRFTKRFATILCAVLLCISAALLVVACKTKPESEPKKEIEISLGAESLTGTAGTAVTIPAATAKDGAGKDISSSLRMNVYFDRDLAYVYPLTNPRNGVDGSISHTYTPKKAGAYTVSYTAVDDEGTRATKEISLNVSASGEERAKQLVADTENWVFDTKGSKFDDEGKVTMYSDSDPSVAYGGRKIKSGDTVSVCFNTDLPDGTAYYILNSHMSWSYDKEKPASTEGVWPPFLSLRVRLSNIEVYFVSANSIGVWQVGTINAALLDEKDHTVSMQAGVNEDGGAVYFNVWVDADTETEPQYAGEFTKEEICSHYDYDAAAFDTEFGDMFDEEKFGGYFNAGAYRSTNGKSDTMHIKSLSVNGEQLVLSPVLQTEAPESFYLTGTQITFPSATAEDQNDYGDLTSRIKLTVRSEAGDEVLEGYTYTPTVQGVYGLVYSVTDYSGNKAFAYYTFMCADAEMTEKPVITLSDDADKTIEVGGSVALPTVVSATDEQGNDITSLLEVTLVGPEGRNVKNETSLTLYSEGEHILRYSVTDYCGNKTVKDVRVTVTSPHKGELDFNDFDMRGNLKVENGMLNVSRDSANGAYKLQKIYGEKVTMIVDAHFASAYGAGDGINMIVFNLRAGMNTEFVPGGPGCGGWEWPTGLNLEINASDGITVYGARHNDSLLLIKQALIGGTRNVFDGPTLFAYQVTDEYREGKFYGTRITVWIDGEEFFSEVVLARKSQSACPKISTAGWFSVYVNGSSAEPSYIRAMTIDGSTPRTLEASIPAGEEDKLVNVSATYTLPAVTASFGGTDITDSLQKYIWINGEDEPDYTEAFAESDVEIGGEYIKGFKVVYRYNNITVATVNVRVNAEPTDIQFSTPVDNLTVNVGGAFTYPVITSFKFGTLTVTEGIRMKLSYPNTAIAETSVSGTSMTVEFAKNFKVSYYYGSIFLTDVSVTVTPNAEDTYENITVSSNHGAFEGFKVYDEKFSVTLNTAIYAQRVEIAFRGAYIPASPGQFPGGNDDNYPRGLRLVFTQSAIQVKSGLNEYDCLFQATNVGEYFGNRADFGKKRDIVFTFRAVDEFNTDGTFKGVRVNVWINGKQVVWSSDNLITPKGVEHTAYGEWWLTPGYVTVAQQVNQTLMQEGLFQNLVIGEPTITSVPAGSETASVSLGETYTLANVTVKKGDRDLSEGIKKYIWVNGTEEPNYESDEFELATNSVTTTIDHIAGFKIVYRYNNKTIATTAVSVQADINNIQFSGETQNLTVALGATLANIPTVTKYQIGAMEITDVAGIVTKVGYPGTAIAEEVVTTSYKAELLKNFELRYYNGDTLLQSFPVTVTGEAQEFYDLQALHQNGGSFDIAGDHIIFTGGRKVYDSKFSMTFDIVSFDGVTDIVFRGDFTGINKDWPNIARVRISGENITIKINGEAEHGKVATSKIFPSYPAAQGAVTVTIQARDVYENGTFTKIAIDVWFNGNKVVWDEGNGEVPASEALQAPDKFLTPCYPYFTTHVAANAGLSHVHSIEHGEPTKVTIEGNKTEDSVGLGASYTIPAVTVTRGTEDLSAQVKKYYVVNGASEPDYATAQEYTEATVAATNDNIVGFKIVYRCEGRTVATVTVIVSAEVNGVVFDTDIQNLSATFGSTWTLPTVTKFNLGATEMSGDDVTVKLVYPNTALAEQAVTGSVKIDMYRNFELIYYYGANLLGRVPVTVTGEKAQTVDLTTYAFPNSDKSGDRRAYNERKVYDEKFSVVIDIKKFGSPTDIVVRGTSASNTDWPAALRLRVNGNTIRMVADTGGNTEFASVSTSKYLDGVKDDVKFTFEIKDTFDENGEFTGISLKLWINGVEVVWDSGGTVGAAAVNSNPDWYLSPCGIVITSHESDNQPANGTYKSIIFGEE